MIATYEMLRNIRVIKRDGKIVPFDRSKIAIAIGKAFSDVDPKEEKYCDDDIWNVCNKVLLEIQSKEEKSITIEEVQDLVEKVLLEEGYEDIFSSYANYRKKRQESRELFLGKNKQHKFLKNLESLGLKSAKENDAKRENANVDGDTAMGTMLQYGSTVSKEFAKAYLIKKGYTDAHDSGDIHIHDMDFVPMGTTTCNQINLEKLFTGGFSTGHGHLREPNDIISYAALAAIAIQSNQNDQHGGQSVPAFDYYMAPGVLKTFKKQWKQTLHDLLEFANQLTEVNMDSLFEHISAERSIDVDQNFYITTYGTNELLQKAIKNSYDKALKKTQRLTYQAMEAFIHNLNTMHSRAGAQVPFSSINFGTDTSEEGRMVTRNYLLALDSGLGKGETPIFPISIFKVKESINYNPEDPNYDLFELSCKVSAKRLFPNFSFIDSNFNLEYYKPGDYKTEVAYMGCRTRVLGNVADPSKSITPGRGNLSFTTINLPRLGIKHGLITHDQADLEGFFRELSSKMELVKEQLLERFEYQCNKRIYNFPFLLGQGVWINSDQLTPKDNLREILKHGTLTFGFIGLAECLKALIGKHHGESEDAQELGLKIISFMREKADEYAAKYQLNFSLIATPAEGLAGRFTKIDRVVYGKIEGITDREYYTNSFHVPVYYPVTISNKILLEGPYHKLTNAGHISYIELDGDVVDNKEAFIKVVRLMKEANMGYGAINHPVDRDPICGYTGVIGDECPGCQRREDSSVPFERIRRITGYLVGTVDRFNNGKRAEEKERLKHYDTN